MMSVYLCALSQETRNCCQHTLENVMLMEDWDLEFLVPEDEKDLICTSQIRHRIKHDASSLYLLEVADSSDESIRLGIDLRRIDPRGFIVYLAKQKQVTPHWFLSLSSGYVEPMCIIYTDQTSNISGIIKDCLREAYHRYCAQISPPLLPVRTGYRTYQFPRDQIQYLTIIGPHQIRVVSQMRCKDTYGTLRSYEKRLGSAQFFRCNRTHLINLRSVKTVDYHTRMVHFQNGSNCRASARGIRRLKRRFEGSQNCQDMPFLL